MLSFVPKYRNECTDFLHAAVCDHGIMRQRRLGHVVVLDVILLRKEIHERVFWHHVAQLIYKPEILLKI